MAQRLRSGRSRPDKRFNAIAPEFGQRSPRMAAGRTDPPTGNPAKKTTPLGKVVKTNQTVASPDNVRLRFARSIGTGDVAQRQIARSKQRWPVTAGVAVLQKLTAFGKDTQGHLLDDQDSLLHLLSSSRGALPWNRDDQSTLLAISAMTGTTPRVAGWRYSGDTKDPTYSELYGQAPSTTRIGGFSAKLNSDEIEIVERAFSTIFDKHNYRKTGAGPVDAANLPPFNGGIRRVLRRLRTRSKNLRSS